MVKNNGGHFDLTFGRSRTSGTAVVEQKMDSAYPNYVKTIDYQLVQKNDVRLLTGLFRKSNPSISAKAEIFDYDMKHCLVDQYQICLR
jgi:hypothetical protein